MNNPSNLLSNALDDAYHILFIKNLGVNHAEPTFVRIFEIIKQDNSAKEWLLECAKNEIVSGGEIIDTSKERPPKFIDEDLICFLAHATKWEEFKSACNERQKSQEYLDTLSGSRDISDSVTAALRDDWEDKVFYKWRINKRTCGSFSLQWIVFIAALMYFIPVSAANISIGVL